MITSLCRRAWLFALAIALAWPATPANAQKPPTDLTELNIEEILSLRINRHGLKRWSAGYRFVYAKFDGYRDGTDNLNLPDVLGRPSAAAYQDGPFDPDLKAEIIPGYTANTYPVTPTVITQQAHLFDISYHLNKKLTLGLLLPFISQSSNHESIVPNFAEFNITSSGLGDISVSASYLAWQRDKGHLVANLGLKLPTGSIDELGPTPRDPNNDTLLPYTMQIGSGTFDFEPSLAYGNNSGQWHYGARTYATLRLGSNAHDYTLGNRFGLNTSLRTDRFSWVNPFVGLGFQSSGEIRGVDNDLKVPLRKIGSEGPVSDENGNPVFETTTDAAGHTVPVMVFPAPVTNPALFGGQELALSLGGKIALREGMALQIRYDIPIYQDLNGPQPKEVAHFDLGWTWTF